MNRPLTRGRTELMPRTKQDQSKIEAQALTRSP
jgi:hypothetical protein